MKKAVDQYWNSEDCYLVFFGDSRKEDNLTIARESEYHPDTDEVIVVDVFWDDNDEMTECHEINPKSLKYYEEECEIQPNITRKEYNDIVEYTKKMALESLKKHYYYSVNVAGKKGYSFIVSSNEELDECEVIDRANSKGLFQDKEDAEYAVVDNVSEKTAERIGKEQIREI